MTAPAAPRYGEIYDRGYQHYTGTRLGRRHAIWALSRYSMSRALGLKKSWTAKIIPILLYIALLIPVVVAIGVQAFFAAVFPVNNFLDYPAYFGGVFLIEGVFVATIAPEMLCPDRQERVLPLYFSRAITRPDYVFGKLLAAGVLTLTVSLVPAALLWIGRQFLAPSPLAAMRNHLDDLGRIAVAGVLIAFYLGAIGLAISSFTGRKSIAVGIIIIGFLMAEAISGALTFAFENNERARAWLGFLSPTRTTAALVGALWNVDAGGIDAPLPAIVGVMLAVIAICVGIMYGRYVPND
ncbi:MAG TPA: ABC transporter permease subunit [Thermomicrobiales bacterium]|nr:ABC transporter permease subunit [Thermomicrobiales bacterium]